MSNFSYTLQLEPGDQIVAVSAKGRLIDAEQAQDMLDEIDSMLKRGKANFIFDLSELEYINSSGLNHLVNLLTKARSRGGDVVLTNLSEKVKSLFIVTKLNTVFTVTEDRDAALANF